MKRCGIVNNEKYDDMEPVYILNDWSQDPDLCSTPRSFYILVISNSNDGNGETSNSIMVLS